MIWRFLKDERGATAIEYGLIASLIGLAIVGSFSQLADQLQALWGDNNGEIQKGLNKY
ncbi:MAG: Flp family type IVb pilin [Proteobacteria bacterium]|jgi:pilus assembly protein Flp/PilA|uniref:Flp family type IVb pilin n=1 Tax=Hyphomicrobiales TaxID=356 RepID=UPI00037DC819|nr:MULTISPECIES: Flp family type IVb pilin [Phyllobacteriaceae]MCA0278657.1 Flp family type IVb pilin [Pseudomonadota bacterium]MCX8567837.1 Flp family type IVb pilin [Aminobacter sp. MET-1]